MVVWNVLMLLHKLKLVYANSYYIKLNILRVIVFYVILGETPCMHRVPTHPNSAYGLVLSNVYA